MLSPVTDRLKSDRQTLGYRPETGATHESKDIGNTFRPGREPGGPSGAPAFLSVSAQTRLFARLDVATNGDTVRKNAYATLGAHFSPGSRRLVFSERPQRADTVVRPRNKVRITAANQTVVKKKRASRREGNTMAPIFEVVEG